MRAERGLLPWTVEEIGDATVEHDDVRLVCSHTSTAAIAARSINRIGGTFFGLHVHMGLIVAGGYTDLPTQLILQCPLLLLLFFFVIFRITHVFSSSKTAHRSNIPSPPPPEKLLFSHSNKFSQKNRKRFLFEFYVQPK